MSLSKSNGSNSNRKSRIRDKIKDNSNVFMKMLIDFKVPLEYRYVNRLLTENILEYLNKRFAGKCCEQGYIQPDSISIVNYSSGIVKNNIIIWSLFTVLPCTQFTEHSSLIRYNRKIKHISL